MSVSHRQAGRPGVRAPRPVEAVLRALDVLDCFHRAGRALGIADVAAITGLSRPTVYRMLVSLGERGFVEQVAGSRQYTVGVKLLQYGVACLHRMDLHREALPVMRRLRDETRETVTLSLRLGDHRVYVDQVESPQEVRQTVELGRTCSLYAGSSGKAILAFLPPGELAAYLERVPLVPLTERTIVDREVLLQELEAVRRWGYATSAGERMNGAASAAAPIRNRHGEVIGSMSICGPASRFILVAEQMGPLVREGAADVSARLGYLRS